MVGRENTIWVKLNVQLSSSSFKFNDLSHFWCCPVSLIFKNDNVPFFIWSLPPSVSPLQWCPDAHGDAMADKPWRRQRGVGIIRYVITAHFGFWGHVLWFLDSACLLSLWLVWVIVWSLPWPSLSLVALSSVPTGFRSLILCHFLHPAHQLFFFQPDVGFPVCWVQW